MPPRPQSHMVASAAPRPTSAGAGRPMSAGPGGRAASRGGMLPRGSDQVHPLDGEDGDGGGGGREDGLMNGDDSDMQRLDFEAHDDLHGDIPGQPASNRNVSKSDLHQHNTRSRPSSALSRESFETYPDQDSNRGGHRV